MPLRHRHRYRHDLDHRDPDRAAGPILGIISRPVVVIPPSRLGGGRPRPMVVERLRDHPEPLGRLPRSAGIAALGVAGMVPAVVLLGGRGACFGPASSRATGAAAPRWRSCAPRMARRLPGEAGNGINQQLVVAQAALDRAARAGVFEGSPPFSAPTTS